MDERVYTESSASELLSRIEEELVSKYNQYRYTNFSTGIAMALDTVKKIANELDIKTE